MLITSFGGYRLGGAAGITEDREITQTDLKRLETRAEMITARSDLGKMQMKAAGREGIQNAK